MAAAGTRVLQSSKSKVLHALPEKQWTTGDGQSTATTGWLLGFHAWASVKNDQVWRPRWEWASTSLVRFLCCWRGHGGEAELTRAGTAVATAAFVRYFDGICCELNRCWLCRGRALSASKAHVGKTHKQGVLGLFRENFGWIQACGSGLYG